LRVDDIHAALAQLKARGAKLIDEQPRPGAEGALVAFIHPAAAHGVLVELKQAGLVVRSAHHERFSERSRTPRALAADPSLTLSSSPFDVAQGDREALEGSKGERTDRVQRFTLGDIELISLCDGFFRGDGGTMFGAVP